MARIRKFLQKRLKLKVNEQKGAVDRLWKLKFLGFSTYKAKAGQILIRLALQAIERK
ncbi:MAG: RNA-directed polymerase [Thermacetogenium sp.]|nr:RNA-directed polymerase [Thermacetogenium sp.]